MTTYDFTVIGGGIVGLATALELTKRYPDLKLALVEKEAGVARHQTGRNSGVVHSGIYYKPGSLKARLCVRGARLMRDFCKTHDLPFERVGKVIVATRERELGGLEALLTRGEQNGVPNLRLLGPAELREIEPHAAGLGAIHSPHTAIVDYGKVAQKIAALLMERGVRLEAGAPVTSITGGAEGFTIETSRGEIRTRALINCAGLYADRIARMSGVEPSVRIVPFRGEYYFLKSHRRDLVRGLIYPVPDPDLPFLGVHFTRTVGGEVEAGPNAVLAFAREGYTYGAVSPADLLEVFSFRGFWHLSKRFWRTGAYEYYRSLSPRAFVASLQKLVPSVTLADVRRGNAGVRAQAIDEQGRLIDDFAVQETHNALHVLNAPSPAATASLAIGEHLAGRAGGLLSGRTDVGSLMRHG